MAAYQTASTGAQVTPGKAPWHFPMGWALIVLWLVAFAAGSVGMAQRLMDGHRGADYGSYLTWGLWVAVYQYLIEMAAGAFILAAAIHLLHIKSLQRLVPAALLLSLASLAAGILAVWVDLGRMERFWRVIFTPSFSSLIVWVVIAYTAFIIIAAAALWFSLRHTEGNTTAPGVRGASARLLKLGSASADAATRDRTDRTLGILLIVGLIPAIGFSGGEGALFGVVGARPYWNSPIFPIAFLASSVVTAGATLVVLAAFFLPARRQTRSNAVVAMSQITMIALAALLLLQFADASVGAYASVPAQQDAMREVLRGDYWWNFWIVQLVIGAAIPFAILLVRGKSPTWLAIACFLVAAGMMSLRLNAVIPGQIIPQLEGIETAFVSDRLTFDYFPSAMEWLVSLFIASVTVLIFYIGYRVLPFAAGPEAETVSTEGN